MYTKIMKACCTCRKIFGEENFYSSKNRSDGLHPSCKNCSKIKRRETYLKHKESILEQGRIWRENNKERMRFLIKRWENNNPDKVREKIQRYRLKNKLKVNAADSVRHAVWYGSMKKPSTCSKCHKKAVIHGHHPDYKLKRFVIWLCPQCHKDAHKNG